MRNVEAGLGRGEGGSERIREDPRGLGRGRVELWLGGIRGFSRVSGANPDAGSPFPGPFWDAKALKNPPPTPGLNSSLKKTHLKSKNQLKMQKRGF